MAKFQVSTSPRSSFTIGNSRCIGGTWYSPSDVGVDEENLAEMYPFLKWDSPPKKLVREQPLEEKILPEGNFVPEIFVPKAEGKNTETQKKSKKKK